MTFGGDTGLLIGISTDVGAAVARWQQVRSGSDDLVLSPLSLCEFLVYHYKRGSGTAARQIVAQMRLAANVRIVPVDGAIAERAAGFVHGVGLPTVDAVILATFVSQGCDLALSTDGHFRMAGERGIIPVEMLV